MRRISQFNLALAIAIAGVTGISMIVPTDAAYAAKKKKEKAADFDISQEYREAYGKAQEAVNAEDLAGAKAQAEAITAISNTPDEKFLLGQLMIQIGARAKDTATQLSGLKLAIESGKLSTEEAQKFNFFAGNFEFGNGNYANARRYLGEALRLGYAEPAADSDPGGILSEAYFKENMFAAGLQSLEQSVARRQAANLPVSEGWFRRGTSIALNNKLSAEASKWTRMWITAYPSGQNWRDALTIYRNDVDLGSQGSLDIMRLMRRTDSLTSERDYADYSEFADVRRLPGEVKAVLEEGQAKGNINTSTPFFAEQLQSANARIKEDRASLAESEAAAARSKDGLTAMATGDAYLGYGDAAKALKMYQLALDKGGVDVDRVRMRLAISAADSGDMVMAKQQMAMVGGERAALASYWMIWLDQQSNGASVAPTAATL